MTQIDAWYEVTDGTLVHVMPRTGQGAWFRSELRTDVAVIASPAAAIASAAR